MRLIVLIVLCLVVITVCSASGRQSHRRKSNSSGHSPHGGRRNYRGGHRSHGKHGGGGRYSHRSLNYRANGKSKVTLASGDSAQIGKPSKSRRTCRKKSSLVTMRSTDKKWKKEYETVKREMEITNKNTQVTYNIIKIQKIFNPCLWKSYTYRRDAVYDEVKTTNERMLFHGSPVANKLALYGFDERYANAGGYFGAGLYFADRSSKSHDYAKPQADGTRYMLLCRVTLGKTHTENGQPNRFAHAPVNTTSVIGALGDTEYIVYRGEQAYPAYLITYK